jgi:hemoglobin-like flavoprotein
MGAFIAVSESFDRCMESGGFFNTFYDLFLDSSPEIPAFFAHTDFVKQKMILKTTVSILVRHDIGSARANKILSQIGATHGNSGYKIEEHLYAYWLESLCKSVKKHDALWSEALEVHWRQRMQSGIDIILLRSG